MTKALLVSFHEALPLARIPLGCWLESCDNGCSWFLCWSEEE